MTEIIKTPTPEEEKLAAEAAKKAAEELAERTTAVEGDPHKRIKLASDVESVEDEKEPRLLSGKEYAEKKEIVVEKPLKKTEFNRAWKVIQERQAKEGYKGMIIPADLKDRVWDYIQPTFKGKDENLSKDELTKALTAAIEKEGIFFKMIELDTVERNEDGSPKNKFSDGSLNEGDYIDSLAMGDPEKHEDNIDPELLAYLRATNKLGLGSKADQNELDIKSLEKQYEAVTEKLRALNIQNIDSLRANIDKLGANPTPAQAMQVLKDGKVDKSQVAQYESSSQVNSLGDLLKIIIEFITGKKYNGSNFNNNSDRYSGGTNESLVPGEAVASNAYLNEVIEKLPDGARKQILMTAAGDLGKNEGDRQLMAACSRAGGISAGPQPWCMAWVQKILGQTGNGAARRTAWARDGLKMGPSSTSNPQPGDLVVVARGSGGHIGFFLGTDKSGKPIIIGGNQAGDKVSVKVERRSLLGIVNVAG